MGPRPRLRPSTTLWGRARWACEVVLKGGMGMASGWSATGALAITSPRGGRAMPSSADLHGYRYTLDAASLWRRFHTPRRRVIRGSVSTWSQGTAAHYLTTSIFTCHNLLSQWFIFPGSPRLPLYTVLSSSLGSSGGRARHGPEWKTTLQVVTSH